MQDQARIQEFMLKRERCIGEGSPAGPGQRPVGEGGVLRRERVKSPGSSWELRYVNAKLNVF